MSEKVKQFIKPFLKKDLPDVRPGDTVKVYQKLSISESAIKSAKKTADEKKKGKEKIQIFEGLVLARKHGKGISSTITVRKLIGGIGVEKIFPLHLPSIEKIEIIHRGKVRRAKLYYLRERVGKKAKLRKREEKAEKK